MMRVAELTGAHLDYWVARAEGIPAEQLTLRQMQRSTDCHVVHEPRSFLEQYLGPRVLAYSRDWGHGGPLIYKWGVSLRDPAEAHRGEQWEAHVTTRDDGCCYSHNGDAPTPLQAICRAVVRAKFGDEVPDINE